MGSPAGRGPLPGSWPFPCQTEATITSGGQGAPFSAHALPQDGANVLGEQGSAVDLQTSVRVRAAAREQIRRRGHSGLGRSLSDPNALELDTCLCAPPNIDRRLVHGELDPVRAEPISERERKLGRDDRVVDPDLLHRAGLDLAARLGAGEPALDEILVPELEVVEKLRVREKPSEASRLETARQDVRLPVDLGEQEGIADRDRISCRSVADRSVSPYSKSPRMRASVPGAGRPRLGSRCQTTSIGRSSPGSGRVPASASTASRARA